LENPAEILTVSIFLNQQRLGTIENPIFGPNFFYSLLRPN
jgi:hypothetical protein